MYHHSGSPSHISSTPSLPSPGYHRSFSQPSGLSQSQNQNPPIMRPSPSQSFSQPQLMPYRRVGSADNINHHTQSSFQRQYSSSMNPQLNVYYENVIPPQPNAIDPFYMSHRRSSSGSLPLSSFPDPNTLNHSKSSSSLNSTNNNINTPLAPTSIPANPPSQPGRYHRRKSSSSTNLAPTASSPAPVSSAPGNTPVNTIRPTSSLGSTVSLNPMRPHSISPSSQSPTNSPLVLPSDRRRNSMISLHSLNTHSTHRPSSSNSTTVTASHSRTSSSHSHSSGDKRERPQSMIEDYNRVLSESPVKLSTGLSSNSLALESSSDNGNPTTPKHNRANSLNLAALARANAASKPIQAPLTPTTTNRKPSFRERVKRTFSFGSSKSKPRESKVRESKPLSDKHNSKTFTDPLPTNSNKSHQRTSTMTSMSSMSSFADTRSIASMATTATTATTSSRTSSFAKFKKDFRDGFRRSKSVSDLTGTTPVESKVSNKSTAPQVHSQYPQRTNSMTVDKPMSLLVNSSAASFSSIRANSIALPIDHCNGVSLVNTPTDESYSPATSITTDSNSTNATSIASSECESQQKIVPIVVAADSPNPNSLGETVFPKDLETLNPEPILTSLQRAKSLERRRSQRSSSNPKNNHGKDANSNIGDTATLPNPQEVYITAFSPSESILTGGGAGKLGTGEIPRSILKVSSGENIRPLVNIKPTVPLQAIEIKDESLALSLDPPMLELLEDCFTGGDLDFDFSSFTSPATPSTINTPISSTQQSIASTSDLLSDTKNDQDANPAVPQIPGPTSSTYYHPIYQQRRSTGGLSGRQHSRSQSKSSISSNGSSLFNFNSIPSAASSLVSSGLSTGFKTTTFGRSGTRGPRVTFSSRIIIYDAYNSEVYDRSTEPATCNFLTPALAHQIKEELNALKVDMDVHLTSRKYTHFY
ncbi:hypothetical protein NADFUDRAFT_45167 [Nadsonia fulvescens var. elongata DSM 6958]|uniref:Uncharacterized protein n=1 Tax=Nadsonia fulvescens var. elongata DSM 6958 TaxID=857566 RepID=A0A1E3PTC2_9ASCO|nr:hypothetical protein NADFUDRAFT_45167 [Nadsonia fulvescens var. elongata DSM 6958]